MRKTQYCKLSSNVGAVVVQLVTMGDLVKSVATTAIVEKDVRAFRSAERVHSNTDVPTAGYHQTQLVSFQTCTAVVVVSVKNSSDVGKFLVSAVVPVLSRSCELTL